MRPDALAAALDGDTTPAIVCAQAGNVNSGAFDPLDEIAAIAQRHGAWLHVDGAFGLWAAASPSLRHHTRGVELADSWATDAHKWLNVPYDSGLVFVAHPAAHRAAMSLSAAYLIREDSRLAPAASARGEAREPMDWTPESSRRARGFAVYAALRSLGRSGVADMVERCCRLARRFAERLRAEPGLAILNDVVLNQVLVRLGPAAPDRRRRRADAGDDSGRAGGTRLLGRRHALARHGCDADLGVELVDDRRGCRSVGGVDRARRAARVTPRRHGAAERISHSARNHRGSPAPHLLTGLPMP